MLSARMLIFRGLIVVMLAVAGCSDTGSAVDMGASPDLSGRVDLSSSPDLGAPATTTKCGNVIVYGPQGPNVSAACVACVDTTCCAEGTACGASDCAALRLCLLGCNATDACSVMCNGMYPNGQSANAAFINCRSQKCNNECASLACVGSVVNPAPTMAMYTFPLVLTDFLSGQPAVGATVKVCALSDGACANPLSRSTTGANGTAMVTAPSSPAGIDGYLEISGDMLVTALSYSIFSDPTKIFVPSNGIRGQVVSKSTFGALAGVIGVMPDATRGHLVVRAKGCADDSLANAKLSVSTADASSTTAYFSGGLPSMSAKATDSSGLVTAVNLPVGLASVSVTLTSSGMTLGKLPVQVRAGALTQLNLGPTP